MNKQSNSKLANLADLVGDFIRYWGFRKIHGEIWTAIYLAENALSGAEIVLLLDVSKALVSPALKELEAEGLILETKSENSKTKRYIAQEDVSNVIKQVLNRREKPMLAKIKVSFDQLAKDAKIGTPINLDRQQKLGGMIERAQLMLQLLANSDEMWG
ncbi:MAG: hypothetical protein H7328_13790 [Bdellovibrio sp.]|nr:hypothetical protein [Bdellovibrio sp.]